MPTTRIITLMFHRVNDQDSHFKATQFSRYLAYLIQHFPIVVPGGSLPDVPIAICLTFDDAYYDFYHHVYPLLKQYQIKAILAVPVKYIVERTDLPSEARLAIPYPEGMTYPVYKENVPFCTWEELREMVKSEHVLIASHGFAHANLSDKNTDVLQEIQYSKTRLKQELHTPIKYFVYPFGKMTRSIHKMVCQSYDYGIRIGSALNLGWEHKQHFIYRVDAQRLFTQFTPITRQLVNRLTLKYWSNRVRCL